MYRASHPSWGQAKGFIPRRDASGKGLRNTESTLVEAHVLPEVGGWGEASAASVTDVGLPAFVSPAVDEESSRTM